MDHLSQSGHASLSHRNQPWIEKYRPKRVSDVAHQEEVVRALNHTLETGSLPHLLFYGPPGTGKTSTALAIAKQLFPPEIYRQRVLELNASDERGISVVRHKIKDFAASAIGSGIVHPSRNSLLSSFVAKESKGEKGDTENKSSSPPPPFKIIILDEADSMTDDAQNALRRTMERYSHITRFILICNYVSRIIGPLTSRCAKFRFKPLVSAAMNDRIRFVCETEALQLTKGGGKRIEEEGGRGERMEVDDGERGKEEEGGTKDVCDLEALKTLEEVSEGDLRRAIMILQSAARLFGNKISCEDILQVSTIVPPSLIQLLLSLLKTKSIDRIISAMPDISAQGFPANQILSQLNEEIICLNDLSDLQKAKICSVIAQADKNLTDGADEYLQILNVLCLAQRAVLGLSVTSPEI